MRYNAPYGYSRPLVRGGGREFANAPAHVRPESRPTLSPRTEETWRAGRSTGDSLLMRGSYRAPYGGGGRYIPSRVREINAPLITTRQMMSNAPAVPAPAVWWDLAGASSRALPPVGLVAQPARCGQFRPRTIAWGRGRLIGTTMRQTTAIRPPSIPSVSAPYLAAQSSTIRALSSLRIYE